LFLTEQINKNQNSLSDYFQAANKVTLKLCKLQNRSCKQAGTKEEKQNNRYEEKQEYENYPNGSIKNQRIKNIKTREQQ
jgi:hypothetical protein